MRIIVMLLFVFPFSSLASEEELLGKFFGPDGIENKAQVYAGEMLKHYVDKPTLGQSLPPGVVAKFRKLETSSTRTIFAVLLTKDGSSRDWYAYLLNEKGKWKISSIRNLALPGLFFMGLKGLEGKSDRTEEEEFRYQNMLLTIKTDAELKNYLKNKEKLGSENNCF